MIQSHNDKMIILNRVDSKTISETATSGGSSISIPYGIPHPEERALLRIYSASPILSQCDRDTGGHVKDKPIFLVRSLRISVSFGVTSE